MKLAQNIDEIAQHIDVMRADPGQHQDLLAFLDERAACYQGRGAQDTDRLRTYALAAISQTSCVPAAEPVIIEELETGYNPYLVAAAAQAATKLDSPPHNIADLLIEAATRLRTSDSKVWFDTMSRAPRPEIETTLLTVIFETLHHFSPLDRSALDRLQHWCEAYGHFLSPVPLEALESLLTLSLPASTCCGGKTKAPGKERVGRDVLCPDIAPDIWGINVEDHGGQSKSFEALRDGKPSVLAFFYTRCLNPEKCSLTVSNLAQLHRLAEAAGLSGRVNIFGMSYDPDWDTSRRLWIYGRDRNFPFAETTRLIRSRERWDELVSAFDLRVGYGPTTVNRHQIDLFVIDGRGRIAERYVQRKWPVESVFASLQALTPQEKSCAKRHAETV